MDIFEIMLSMFDYLLYVIIIMLIYGIKMVRKMPIILTRTPSTLALLQEILSVEQSSFCCDVCVRYSPHIVVFVFGQPRRGICKPYLLSSCSPYLPNRRARAEFSGHHVFLTDAQPRRVSCFLLASAPSRLARL
jgi:hypothetical protein